MGNSKPKPVPAVDPALARGAWKMLTRDDNPMPAGVAVDWLREAAGTDDVEAVKLAICKAAGESLRMYAGNIGLKARGWLGLEQWVVWMEAGKVERLIHNRPYNETSVGIYGDWWRAVRAAQSKLIEVKNA